MSSTGEIDNDPSLSENTKRLSEFAKKHFIMSFELRSQHVELAGQILNNLPPVFQPAPQAFLDALQAISDAICLPQRIALQQTLKLHEARYFVHALHVINRKGFLPGEDSQSAITRVTAKAQGDARKRLEESKDNPEGIEQLVRDSTEALVGSVDNESIIPGARELRYQAVVALWSCIEVLLKDQIILLLNTYPKLSHRLLNDEQTKKKFELPKLTYEDLVERGFDFRACMGEMILRSRDGSDLNTLKSAVKVLFGVDDLYKSLDTECIRMLNLQRHLIVHRRGIVDSKYVKQSGATTPIDAPIDVHPSQIVTHFNQVAELGKHAIISFQKLLAELATDESVK